jgi:hypothetical protein
VVEMVACSFQCRSKQEIKGILCGNSLMITLPTGEKLELWFPEEKGDCHFCKQGVENAEHLFSTCPFIKNIWLWLNVLFHVTLDNNNNEVFPSFQ